MVGDNMPQPDPIQLQQIEELMPEIEAIDNVAAGWIRRHILEGGTSPNDTDPFSQSMAIMMLTGVLQRLGRLDDFHQGSYRI